MLLKIKKIAPFTMNIIPAAKDQKAQTEDDLLGDETTGKDARFHVKTMTPLTTVTDLQAEDAIALFPETDGKGTTLKTDNRIMSRGTNQKHAPLTNILIGRQEEDQKLALLTEVNHQIEDITDHPRDLQANTETTNHIKIDKIMINTNPTTQIQNTGTDHPLITDKNPTITAITVEDNQMIDKIDKHLETDENQEVILDRQTLKITATNTHLTVDRQQTT